MFNNNAILNAHKAKAANLLWGYLRTEREHFKQNTMIGFDYTVDFACMSKHIIIELISNTDEIEKKAKKLNDLKGMGYNIITVKIKEIMTDIDSVVDKIREQL